MPILRSLLLVLLTLPAFAQLPEIAPGVTLPASSVSVVDQDADGTLKPIRLASAVVAADAHTGSNVAKGLVYANQHNSILLAGKSAPTVLQSSHPSFYVRLPDDHADLFRAQVTLIRMKPAADSRIAFEFTANSFGGNRKRNINQVPVDKLDMQEGKWVKVTPVRPLDPGEYGLVILPQNPNAYSETIYDVSIPSR